MQIPVDKTRITEVWNKTSRNHKPMSYEDFKQSLEKLAVSSLQYRVEKNIKVITKISLALDHLNQDGKLPNSLKAFENKSNDELKEM
jgi:hypothetical protein